MICGSGGSKSGLAKAAGAEPAGQMSDKNCTPLWREAHFEVKMYKTPQRRTTFGSCDVEKVHAVWREAHFQVKMLQNTPWSDDFWQLRCRKSARLCGAKHISKSKCNKTHHVRTTFWNLRCRKSARRCGAKHISKSICTKHTMYGPFLEVQMSFRVAGTRDCGPCQK